MVQKTYFIENENQLNTVITEIKALPEYGRAKSILGIVYANGIDGNETKHYLDILNSQIDDIKMAGISVIRSKENIDENGITISFNIFEESSVDIYSFKCKDYTDEDVIEEMVGVLTDTEHLKMMFCYPSGDRSDFTKILEGISVIAPTVAFFGAMASTNVNYSDVPGELFSAINYIRFHRDTPVLKDEQKKNVVFGISTDEIITDGYVFAAVSGEKLNVQADYMLGWHRLGKAMTVTGRVNDTDAENAYITEIDGLPAAQIYKKYLDVDVDEYFMDNVCEFPLIVEREGSLIARVPAALDENDALWFSGDIRNDEKLTLSYANPKELLQQTKDMALKYRRMNLEALFSVICLNRYQFLKEDQHFEVEFFQYIKNDFAYAYGGYEIFKQGSVGGILNSAMVVVGLTEQPLTISEVPAVCTAKTLQKPGVRPLMERLLKLIEVSTEELEEAKDKAEAASVSKSAFLSNMSHEIRTPINAVLGMDEMILRESREDNILEYAENIRSAGNSLLSIINDILDFSKMEAGKMEIVPVEYELASVINDLINMISKRAADKGLELVVNVEPSIPHILYGDEIRIKQVVTNILTNAVKYTEKGSVSLSIDACEVTPEKIEELGISKDLVKQQLGTCRCHKNKNIILHVSVKDTGIGIKENDLKKLFSAFERIEEKRNRSIEGTGLGMSISRQLLELMGSELKVESEYGKGSTFSFSILQKIVDDMPIGNFQEALKRSLAKREEYQESFVAPDAHILVVDDTPINLTVIKNLLKQTMVRIDTATSGEECLDLAKEKKYDMIFLDHRMPGMDGIETFERLRAQDGKNDETPIIALTANAVSGSREFYLNKGFDNYLTKPIYPVALEKMIVNFLPKDKVQSVSKEDVSPSVELPEEIKSIKDISIEKGIENSGGVDAYLQTIKEYAQSVRENAKLINEYYRNEKWKEYTTKVHALKSVSRIVGAMDLGAMAENLEKAGDENNIDYIKAKNDELIRIYESIGEKINRGFAGEKRDIIKEEITGAKLMDAYRTIYEIAQMYDYDSLTMVMNSLEEYAIPTVEQEKYEQLKKAYKNANWDEIQKLTER